MKYNYLENIKDDIKEYLKTTEERDFNNLYDTLFMEDSVTGNASGSYFMNAYKAEEALAHNLNLLQDACECFGTTPDLSNPEACDVTIRCYLLLDALREVLDSEN